MRLARVACGSASPTVVIMVGPECEGTPRALTQEAAVFSATEPWGVPYRAGGAVMDAAPRYTAVTPPSGEAVGEH
jgi:hypothetical protein